MCLFNTHQSKIQGVIKKFWEQVNENQKVYLIWILGDPPSNNIFLCTSAFMFRSLSECYSHCVPSHLYRSSWCVILQLDFQWTNIIVTCPGGEQGLCSCGQKGLTPWSSWDLRTLQLNPMLMSQSGDLNSGCMPSVLLLTWRSAFRIWSYALFSSVNDLPNEIPKFMFTLFSLQGAQIGLTLRNAEIALMLKTARTYPRRWPWMGNQSNLKQASF